MSLTPLYSIEANLSGQSGGLVLTNAGQTLDAGLQAVIVSGGVPITQTLTSAASIAPNTDQFDVIAITAQAEPLQFDNPVSELLIPNGTKLMIRLHDNGSIRPLYFGSQYRGLVAALPSSTIVGKTTYLGFIYNSIDVSWDLLAFANQL